MFQPIRYCVLKKKNYYNSLTNSFSEKRKRFVFINRKLPFNVHPKLSDDVYRLPEVLSIRIVKYRGGSGNPPQGEGDFNGWAKEVSIVILFLITFFFPSPPISTRNTPIDNTKLIWRKCARGAIHPCPSRIRHCVNAK